MRAIYIMVKKTNRKIKNRKNKKTRKTKGGLRDLIDINNYGHIKIKRAIGSLDFSKWLSGDSSSKDGNVYNKFLEKLKIKHGSEPEMTFYGVGSGLNAVSLGYAGDIKNIVECNTKLATYSIIRGSIMTLLKDNELTCQSIVGKDLILFKIMSFSGAGIGTGFVGSIRSGFARALAGTSGTKQSAYSYKISIKYTISNYDSNQKYTLTELNEKEEDKGSYDEQFWYNFKPYVPTNIDTTGTSINPSNIEWIADTIKI